jgi:tetratricopeptide (TPR) repeat protein
MLVNILRHSSLLFGLSLSSLLAASASAQPPQQPKKPPLGEVLNLSLADVAMTAAETSPEAAIFADADVCPSAEAAFVGDPNEDSADLAARYKQARKLIASGKWNRAKTLLETSLAIYPDSRNLHQLYAELLWYMSDGTNRSLLKQAARAAVRAAEIGLGFDTVDPSLNRRLAEVLGRTRDKATFERIFNAIRAVDDGAGVRLEVARGLRLMKDGGTEAAFRDALDEAEGELAMTELGEWLLEQGRDEEVLSLLPKSPELRYIHLLRGVALERSGRMQEARSAYLQFADYSRLFPAPARFRIPGSTLQAETGIRFQTKSTKGKSVASIAAGDITNITAAVTDPQAQYGLSYLIYGEAVGESVGGKRGVGWLVRDRVLRGSVGSPACPYVVNSGATLADQYKSVMCQGNGSQFNGMCLAWCSNPDTTSCSYTAETDNVAYEVYEGYAPDPVSDHCPSGFSAFGTGVCDSARKCNGARTTYRLDGPLFNYGTSGTCPTLCAPTIKGKTCGNGGLDNCFYANAYCPGTTYPASTNSLSGTGAYKVTNPLYSSVTGTHFGHMDGPDSQDFDLILETSSSSGGPWSTYTSSAMGGSTEEVKVSAPPGYYRWKVLSYSGSGSFTLCAKDP